MVGMVKIVNTIMGQSQNARGSKERPLMKKEATLKCKGLKKKDL
jgi:hypothetical protein